MTLKRTQQRRGTSTQWTTLNPTLAPGEIGFETNTGNFKIGTGIAQWNDLEYFKDFSNTPDMSSVVTQILGDVIPELNTLEKIANSIDGDNDFYGTITGDIVTAKNQAINEANQYTDTAISGLDLSAAVSVARTYTDTQISNLVDSAPGALNTLNELAAALGDDQNYASTITTALSGKQDKISGVSNTEIGYLDGVTSAIQTQIDGKATTSHTHSISNITGLQTAIDGKASTTHTHAISDVTGLQTALDAVSRTSSTITANYTVQSSDVGKVLKVDSASAITITIPAILSANQSFDIYQKGAGVVTLTASGTTLQGVGSTGVNLKISNQYTSATVFADTSTVYAVLGNVEIA